MNRPYAPVSLLHEFDDPNHGYIALDGHQPVHVHREDAPSVRLEGRGLDEPGVLAVATYDRTDSVVRPEMEGFDVLRELTGSGMDGKEATVFLVRTEYDDLVNTLVGAGITVGVYVGILKLLASEEATFL